MKATYRVYEPNLARLLHEVEKLNRRCSKIGAAPVQARRLSVEDKPVLRRDLPGHDGQCGPYSPDEVVGFKRFVVLEVEGDSPKFAGWTLAAVVEHAQEGNLLRKSPDCAAELARFRSCRPACEHCKSDRNRRDTYVLVHESGEAKQVGSSCLKDFLGHKDPHQLAQLAEVCFSLAELCEGCEDEDFFEGGGCSRPLLPVRTFLAYAALATRHHGFVSSKRQKEDFTGRTRSTASTAAFYMRPPKDARPEDLLKPEDQDFARGEAARQHVLGTLGEKPAAELSDFEHNLLTVCKCEAVEERNAGLLAFVPEHFSRESERKAREERAAADSKHFPAAPGTRCRGVKLRYARSVGFESQWGGGFLHFFTSEDGATLLWKTSSAVYEDPGTEFLATFTVKEHGDYRGAKQTTVTRAALEVAREAAAA